MACMSYMFLYIFAKFCTSFDLIFGSLIHKSAIEYITTGYLDFLGSSPS